ncbi:MAG: response regulator [Betaproteobacteria bacterium]|nr:response regulator [Betaproteobacteria bacterium]
MNDVNGSKARRALVVDDDATTVEFVSGILRKLGYHVDTCCDGMSALNRFRAAPYDVVTIDMRMPRLSGISFLKNLRLPPGTPHRIVVLSAMEDQKLQREAIDAGAAAYLLKPATASAIIDAVTSAAASV